MINRGVKGTSLEHMLFGATFVKGVKLVVKEGRRSSSVGELYIGKLD